MKPTVPLLAAAAVTAFVVFRPAASRPPVAASWSSAAPAPRPGARTISAPTALIYVAGAVTHPGVYSLRPDARVRDAVRLAGGVRADAEPVGVNLAAHLRDGDEIVVPVRGAEAATGGAAPARASGARRHRRASGYGRAGEAGIVSDGRSTGGGRGTRRGHRGRKGSIDAAPPAASIDLNAANAEELATVPGIGPGLAIRIVAFREANGPFASADELLDVSGITDRRLDAILPYVVAR